MNLHLLTNSPLATPVGFATGVLGLSLYDWQEFILWDADNAGAIAVKAGNGTGKTTNVAAPLALWHATVFANSLTIITAGVYRQVKEQLFPSIYKHASKFDGWVFNETEVKAPNGSRIIGFSTDEPGKFEGWHAENLFMIVDEAKSVPDCIFEAIERCQPKRLLVMSSPGGSCGFFYEAFSKRRKYFKQHTVTAFQCPHISHNWITEQIEKYGEQHPLVRSMVFAEFMASSEDGVALSLTILERCLQNPPILKSGRIHAFCDFAAGGDENVLAIASGNSVNVAAAWRERDTMSAVGKFIQLFKKYNLSPDNISCDGSGLGIPICDRFAECDWKLRRINNGTASRRPDIYANLAAEIWMQGIRQIELGEVRLPNDPELITQLTSRRVYANSRGQIVLESKEQLRSRGLSSPDRADAVLGCLYLPKATSLTYA